MSSWYCMDNTGSNVPGGDDPALKLLYAKHLLAASVMAAPGAIVISKILYPLEPKWLRESDQSLFLVFFFPPFV